MKGALWPRPIANATAASAVTPAARTEAPEDCPAGSSDQRGGNQEESAGRKRRGDGGLGGVAHVATTSPIGTMNQIGRIQIA